MGMYITVKYQVLESDVSAKTNHQLTPVGFQHTKTQFSDINAFIVFLQSPCLSPRSERLLVKTRKIALHEISFSF